MNLFQKIIFYLWFLCTFGLVLVVIYDWHPNIPLSEVLKNVLQIEGIITVFFGVPFLLFRSTRRQSQ